MNDLDKARIIHERAVAALGELSVGMTTDLLADNSGWSLDHCHELAHELCPGQTCCRPCCVQP